MPPQVILDFGPSLADYLYATEGPDEDEGEGGQMSIPTVEVVNGQPQALERPAATDGGIAATFERLATDPRVDVEKLERLIAMQERILAANAKAEYYAAFAQMQGEIPTITETGAIKVGNEVRSRYATNEDIQDVLRPILQRHGFMLSFRTEFPDKTTVKVIAVLAHRGGHAEQTEFISAADTSGSKNGIQALGSAQTYGQRYTTRALLNITSRERGERDDDGNGATKATLPAAPDGFDDWWTDMQACAAEGWPKLSNAWNKSKREYREYVTKHDPRAWDGLKARAQAVKG